MSGRKLWFGCILALGLVGVIAMPADGWAAASGEKIFKKRCGTCHELPDPNVPPSQGWAKQLDQMAAMASLKSEEKAGVLSYLQSHSQIKVKNVSLAEEKRLFEKKCSLCHTPDRVFLTPLTDKSRSHIVARMQERAPDWISPEESELILDYLSKTPRKVQLKKKKKIKGDAKAIFRQRCAGCHSLERVYLKLEEQKAPSWGHIVKRMQEKAPEWLSKNEATEIMTYLQTLKPVNGEGKK